MRTPQWRLEGEGSPVIFIYMRFLLILMPPPPPPPPVAVSSRRGSLGFKYERWNAQKDTSQFGIWQVTTCSSGCKGSALFGKCFFVHSYVGNHRLHIACFDISVMMCKDNNFGMDWWETVAVRRVSLQGATRCSWLMAAVWTTPANILYFHLEWKGRHDLFIRQTNSHSQMWGQHKNTNCGGRLFKRGATRYPNMFFSSPLWLNEDVRPKRMWDSKWAQRMIINVEKKSENVFILFTAFVQFWL